MEILVKYEDRHGNEVYFARTTDEIEYIFNRIRQHENVWYILTRVYVGDQFVSITYQQEATN